jgi:stage II sporulation protein P
MLFSISASAYSAKQNSNFLNREKQTVYKSSNPQVPTQVIIYNSHPFEKYDCGVNVKEISQLLCNRLNVDKLSAIYIDNNDNEARTAYEDSRKLITNTNLNYNKSILLDIHLGGVSADFKDGITLCIGKKNKNYEANKKFADSILEEIKKSSYNTTAQILINETGTYNQDLSDNSLLIIVGNKYTPQNIINKDIEALADSLNNTVK